MTRISLDERITVLMDAAESVRAAENRSQREAKIKFLTRRAADAMAERDKLYHKLDIGWDRLDLMDRDEDPELYDKREEQYLGWMRDYQRLCDALHEASQVWTLPKRKDAA